MYVAGTPRSERGGEGHLWRARWRSYCHRLSGLGWALWGLYFCEKLKFDPKKSSLGAIRALTFTQQYLMKVHRPLRGGITRSVFSMWFQIAPLDWNQSWVESKQNMQNNNHKQCRWCQWKWWLYPRKAWVCWERMWQQARGVNSGDYSYPVKRGKATN